MRLSPIDWVVVGAYVAFALAVGLRFARRASRDVDQFFLSGRSLPWWIAGTSMVATTFAADTPLVVTGWVRDHGIWKNWLWWCYAGGGMLTVFLFARYWRRGLVMTTAELAELRYGGAESRLLRSFLGFYHSAVTNTIVLCWVLLAAAKIMDVLLGVDQWIAVSIACVLALSYSLLSGFWGVVLTDLVQFTMAIVGAILLAALSWTAIGGGEGLLEAARTSSAFGADTLAFLPSPGAGGPFDASFWTVNVATVAVYLGVAWWAAEAVDGGGLVVQRISAARDEREGVLAVLWYNVAHYALRPWPWILVALASLIVLPHIEVSAPETGVVHAVEEDAIFVATEGGGSAETLRVELPEPEPGWSPLPMVAVGDPVERDQVIARTDSERAYVVMMSRFLPVGLLGLVVASLVAAFMSTIDTHVNLASSYFVNDVYRRLLAPGREPGHYVFVARVASVLVLALAGLLAWQSRSISDLFQFFLAFLGGVGPIYVLRWLWWRVRASTEIVAMVASSVTTLVLSFVASEGWALGPLSPEGVLSPAGRLCIVAFVSLASALGSLLIVRRPEPRDLVPFYRRVRPVGLWSPVRALCPEVAPPRETGPVIIGIVASLAATYGMLFGTGLFFLGRPGAAGLALGLAVLGAVGTTWSLRRLLARTPGA